MERERGGEGGKQERGTERGRTRAKGFKREEQQEKERERERETEEREKEREKEKEKEKERERAKREISKKIGKNNVSRFQKCLVPSYLLRPFFPFLFLSYLSPLSPSFPSFLPHHHRVSRRWSVGKGKQLLRWRANSSQEQRPGSHFSHLQRVSVYSKTIFRHNDNEKSSNSVITTRKSNGSDCDNCDMVFRRGRAGWTDRETNRRN